MTGTTERFYPEHGDFPIEFSGADPNGHHAAYFVKPEDSSSSKYRLHLAIRNVSPSTLDLAPLSPPQDDREPTASTVSATNYHLRLRFRPGIVDGRSIRKALPLANELEQQLGAGWRWHDLATAPDTGEVSVCFSYAPAEPGGDFRWAQGQTLGVQLRPFQNAPLSGAFFLRTELDYGKALGARGGDHTITAREINLAVVDLSGSTFFPGKVAVLGSNTILNNGVPNDRKIELWNAVHGSVIPFRMNTVDHETGSSITVAVRCHHDSVDSRIENHPTVMGERNELSSMTLDVIEQSSGIAWHKNVHDDVPGWLSWEFTPNPEAGVSRIEIGEDHPTTDTGARGIEALTFDLRHLQTTAPGGPAYVYIHFHHLPGLADHTLLVPFDKTPLVIRKQNVGVGIHPSPSAGGDLRVAGQVHAESDVHVAGDVDTAGAVRAHGEVVVDGDARVHGQVLDRHGGELMPVGAIIAYGGSSLPPGWLLCNGDPVPSEYPELRSLLPSGRTPNLLDRFIIGAGSNHPRTAQGGAESVRLTERQMPSHSHTATTTSDGRHEHRKQHTVKLDDDFDGHDKGVWVVGRKEVGNEGNAPTGYKVHVDNDSSSHQHTVTIGSAGAGDAVDTMPPYYALTYIIKC